MREVLTVDLNSAIKAVVEKLPGIDELYPVQIQLLESLVRLENVFFTSATNSGKTLPAVIFPNVVDELNQLGYEIPSGKVLFVTALNSIQSSLVSSMEFLGLECAVITLDNFTEVITSEVKLIFIGPEVLKLPHICRCLLAHRSSFILKVLDEAHLIASWGLRKGDKQAFRPAMALSSGELSGIGGKILMMTATATSKTVRILMDQMPEIKKWKLMLNSLRREKVTVVVPNPEILSAKFEVLLEPFILRMVDFHESYLILVRGTNPIYLYVYASFK